MMGMAWAALGLGFLLFGAAALGLVVFAVVAQHQLFFILATLPALLAVGLGLLIMLWIPYDTMLDDDRLKMFFVFRNECVSRSDVLTFRKLAVRMSFRGGEATVYTLLTYRRPDGSRARAVLLLRGRGPAFSLTASDYETELDRYVSSVDAAGRPAGPVAPTSTSGPT
jgi:hypothetical protein